MIEVLRSKYSRAIAACLAVTALVGCSETKIVENKPGIVTEHKYDDRDLISVKPLMFDPEHFYLGVEQCGFRAGENPGADSTGCIRDWVEVDSQTYEDFPDGSEIVFTDLN